MTDDAALRLIALEALDQLVDQLGTELTRAELRNLALPANPPHLVDRQKGIWNPNWLDATLSVLTVHNSPYPDKELGDGVWAYSFRTGGPGGDNRKLRAARDMGVDLIYFRPGETSSRHYKVTYPVRVAEVLEDRQEVILVRKDVDRIDWRRDDTTESLREYAEQVIQRRVHQDKFRERVMRAYSATCAICGLKYERLLDAAHIDSDKSDFGDPSVNNGLALCKIHHQAYDWNFLGIDSKARVQVKREIRDASDGPMLAHGLQEMHGRTLILPASVRDYPGEDRLARRYEVFKKTDAGTR